MFQYQASPRNGFWRGGQTLIFKQGGLRIMEIAPHPILLNIGMDVVASAVFTTVQLIVTPTNIECSNLAVIGVDILTATRKLVFLQVNLASLRHQMSSILVKQPIHLFSLVALVRHISE